MGENIKSIIFAAKKVVPRKVFKKARKLKDKEEKKEALKYLIKVHLDLKLHKLDMMLRDLEKKEVDVFHIRQRTNLLNTKIHSYIKTYHKSDFSKLMKLFGKVEKDLDEL